MTTTNVRTLHGLLDAGRDDATAIAASGAEPLTYGAFRALVGRTVDGLNGLGIGRSDRVAIVLPNGAEMATAFVAIASGATAAPLNPGYRPDEFEFYMTDIAAKALVVEEGSASPAVAVAEKRGIAVIFLRPDPKSGAGAFLLSGRKCPNSRDPGWRKAPKQRSSCTRPVPPRGRRSCGSVTATSPRRPPTSRHRLRCRRMTGRSTSCLFSTSTD